MMMWLHLTAAVVCLTLGVVNIAFFTTDIIALARPQLVIPRPSSNPIEASDFLPSAAVINSRSITD